MPPSVPPPVPPIAPTAPTPPTIPPTDALRVVEALDLHAAGSLRELEARLATVLASIPPGDATSPVVSMIGSALAECLAREAREVSARPLIRDTETAAYSFPYFVDLAGRELDLARRHGRTFSIATLEMVPHPLREPAHGGAPPLEAREVVDVLLRVLRDTDAVARSDPGGLLVLLPETGTSGARSVRRRALQRLRERFGTGTRIDAPRARLGLSTFPFDGEDFSRLMRIARRRGARWAPLDGDHADAAVSRALAWLSLSPDGEGRERIEPIVDDARASFTPLDVSLRTAWGLIESLVGESTRGGDTTVAYHADAGRAASTGERGGGSRFETTFGLAQAILAATQGAITRGPDGGGGRDSSGSSAHAADDPGLRGDTLSVVAGVSSLTERAAFRGLEIVGVLAEHACWGLIGRVHKGRLVALQTSDLPLVEYLVGTLEQPVLSRKRVNASHFATSNPPLGAVRAPLLDEALADPHPRPQART